MEKWYVVDDGEVYNVLPEEEFDPEFYDRSQVIKVTNDMESAFRIADKLNRAVEEKRHNFSPMKGYFDESKTKSVKLTENQLYTMIENSIKKHLTEDAQLYNSTLGGGPLGDEDGFRGCKNIKIRWHGEHADPELMCDGYLANYYEIEDFIAEMAKEDGVDVDNDETFNQYCMEHESEIQNMIKEMGEKEYDPFMEESKIKSVKLTENQLYTMIGKSIKKHLNEGSTNQKVLDVWDAMIESVGPQVFLDMIYSALSHDQIVDLIKYFNRVYEFGIDIKGIERM